MKKEALIVVDYQNDFANPETGSLYVDGGEKIAEAINQAIKKVKETWGLIIASRESHPQGHISFASNFMNKTPITETLSKGKQPNSENFITYHEIKNWTQENNGIQKSANFSLAELKAYIKTMWTQAVWPDHCVDNTFGSEYFKGFDSSQIDFEIIKWADANNHPYSAFWGFESKNKQSLLEVLKQNTIEQIKIVWLATDYCNLATALDGVKNFNVAFIQKASAWVAPETTIQALENMRKAWVEIIK